MLNSTNLDWRLDVLSIVDYITTRSVDDELLL